MSSYFKGNLSVFKILSRLVYENDMRKNSLFPINNLSDIVVKMAIEFRSTQPISSFMEADI